MSDGPLPVHPAEPDRREHPHPASAASCAVADTVVAPLAPVATVVVSQMGVSEYAPST
ncbi:hypothetical protein [Streptomyces griseorubiginosus]|uniref:hypothetical protein n=1 Tax=Streptomyces griseorubiginosus TaxID=67304 RepID=UPI0036EB9361